MDIIRYYLLPKSKALKICSIKYEYEAVQNYVNFFIYFWNFIFGCRNIALLFLVIIGDIWSMISTVDYVWFWVNWNISKWLLIHFPLVYIWVKFKWI